MSIKPLQIGTTCCNEIPQIYRKPFASDPNNSDNLKLNPFSEIFKLLYCTFGAAL